MVSVAEPKEALRLHLQKRETKKSLTFTFLLLFWRTSPGIPACTSTDLLTLTTFTYHVPLIQGGDLSK